MATNDPTKPWLEAVQSPDLTGTWAPAAPVWPPPHTTENAEDANPVQRSTTEDLRYEDEAREARRQEYLERGRRAASARRISAVIGVGVLMVAVAAAAAYAVAS